MNRYVALLRAVNVSAGDQIDMARLKALATDLGLGTPRTLLRSGNLVVQAADDAAALAARLEAALAKELGLKTEVLVRDAAEWRAMIDANPFPQMAADDPSHLVVMAMREAPAAAAVDALQAAIKGRETLRAAGRHAYVCYPDGIGRSKLTIAMIEKHLGHKGTGRNWNTVLKLADMLEC